MELINKKHKDITSNSRVDLVDYVRPDKKEFYFSAGCNVHLGIIPGLYVHFINDGDRWLFYLNTDTDGFLLLARQTAKAQKKSPIIVNLSLLKLFLKRTNCSAGSKFPVRQTQQKIKDCVVYEIFINEVFE